MNIRQAVSTDLEQLVPLFDAYRIFYSKPGDLNAAQRFLADRIQKNESVIFVAESPNKQLVGFVQLYPIFSSTRMKRYWLLNDLYVMENYRGKGISIQLIERAKQLCIESLAAGMMLETAKSNTIGNKLYPKTGFICDQEHNYYTWDVE